MLVLMKVKDGSQVLATGVLLVLERPGSEDVRKFVHIHINYGCAVVPPVVTAVAEACPRVIMGPPDQCKH